MHETKEARKETELPIWIKAAEWNNPSHFLESCCWHPTPRNLLVSTSKIKKEFFKHPEKKTNNLEGRSTRAGCPRLPSRLNTQRQQSNIHRHPRETNTKQEHSPHGKCQALMGKRDKADTCEWRHLCRRPHLNCPRKGNAG